MGIRGLMGFITKNNSNIVQEIDIRNEIAQWRSEHGKEPTIVIDVRYLNTVVRELDEESLILGGRFQKYNEIVEYFLGELKKCGLNLKFFARLAEGRFKHMEHFDSNINAFDCMKRYGNLRNFSNTNRSVRPNERFWYNLLRLCAKYGQVEAHFWRHWWHVKDYIKDHQRDVLAIMTSETRFLTLDLDFEYWSLTNVQLSTLKIMKFCRKTLYDVLGLSPIQMQLLSTLSNLKNIDTPVQHFLNNLEGGAHSILRLSTYIKKQEIKTGGFDLKKIASDIYGDSLTTELLKNIEQNFKTNSDYNDLVAEVQHKYERHAVKLANEDAEFETFFKFCSNEIFFAYKLMLEYSSIPKDLLYIDVRQSDTGPFIDLMVEVTLKLCGIAFKDIALDKRPKTRVIKIQRVFNEEIAEIEEDIIYPALALPTLNDLIIEEDNQQFAEPRWSLLQWLLDLDGKDITSIKKACDSKYIRIVLITLKFLLSHAIISTHEADILMLTESDGRSKNNVYVPKSFRPPPPMPNWRHPEYVAMSWVQTAHKYTIAFDLVRHCLELCGLRRETDSIQFDAFEFHANMHQSENDNRQIQRMMTRMKNIRLW
ncbi:uncharacterized protein LOC129579974 [Sitodiplosis mosellana]|uniref:uncharacterized protein LOC129579974 n=1 Tax=Sitodiplosis mosellana TaxID=263140 RepID=UPI002444D2FD|nr:uncharacterized protein LOC129579974 [Sitodiplosis mosellana]